jgi:hypothetical protein
MASVKGLTMMAFALTMISGRALGMVTGGARADPLSAAATFILRGLLSECGGVGVSVDGAHRLATGAVSGVRITGRGWRSPGGLACRELAMEVGEARLDAAGLFTARQIRFSQPVTGDASVTFSATDFAAFVRHPLVGPAAVWRGAGAAARQERPPPFVFAATGCVIDPDGVTFGGEWRGAARRLRLSRAAAAPGRAAAASPIEVRPEGLVGEDDEVLAALLLEWFSQLRVDLDGAMVGPIKSLETVEAQGGGSGARSVRLQLGLSVRKFPSLPPKF